LKMVNENLKKIIKKNNLFSLIILSLFLIGCQEIIIEKNNFIEIKSNEDLNPLINLMADKEFVLLGESTHGTQEFYEIRSTISKKLIEKHNFNYIAVEGDWHDIYKINLYIKGLSEKNNAKEVLQTFNRWPQWMWSNKVIEELAEWLKEYNDQLPYEEKIGFYGMDVYGVENSINVLQNNLNIEYECLTNFKEDFSLYANYLSFGNHPCNEEAQEIYLKIKNNNFNLTDKELFYYKQNAFVVKNAEIHYRAMIDQRLSSWNERVIHMNQTLKKLSKLGKGIVWAHNTHVGDASQTSMVRQNSFNIGQLLREANKNVFILGFGTYKGEVLAGTQWGYVMEKMNIPEANKNSYEYILKNKGLNKTLILFENELPNSLKSINNNRAIGVVYNPQQEYPGNYVSTNLIKRYDAFIFIKETNALQILN
ncbi:MAG: erythromycin esterase family protein, partial [Candidatus Woesearchaeota archaeon]